ncbi:hypothetical protein BDC45DRAFT_529753 [Circinella umbellata]|nr:hypothetical protein BDC45DRAFT_529753 [Circinella umbellata]
MYDKINRFLEPVLVKSRVLGRTNTHMKENDYVSLDTTNIVMLNVIPTAQITAEKERVREKMPQSRKEISGAAYTCGVVNLLLPYFIIWRNHCRLVKIEVEYYS